MIKTIFALVKNNNKFLLIQEGGKRNYGLWCLPGGHLDHGENMEQAAVRETQEESGVLIQINKKVLTKAISNQEYLSGVDADEALIEVNVFDGSYISGEARPGEEELAAGWFSKEEIKNLPLRLKFIIELL